MPGGQSFEATTGLENHSHTQHPRVFRSYE